MIGVLVLLIFAVVVYFVVWPWAMIALGNSFLLNPPKPEITYAEFPFRLEYEINGERKIIEDTLICEYDGIGMDEGQGKYRKWKERLASGKQKIILVKVDDTKEIYYPTGSARYYMGDMKEYESYKQSFPDAAFVEKRGRITEDGIIPSDELFKKYKIKLISWDISKPIKNNFPTTKTKK